jgi:hypothetical protein
LVGALNLSAIGKHSRLLPQCHDAIRALHCFLKGGPRNPIITGKGDQLFDVRVSVISEFH